MAFRRRGFRRFRRSYRSRRGGNKRFRRAVRRVNYSIAEVKYFEGVVNPVSGSIKSTWSLLPASFLTADWNNQFSLLGCIQQGTNVGQRIGNKIHVKYVQLSILFSFTNNPSSVATITPTSALFGMFCRYMVMLDKSPSRATLPFNYMSTGFGAGAAYGFTSCLQLTFRDFNQLKTSKVLLDMQHKNHNTSSAPVAANGVSSTTGIQVVQHFIKVNRDFTYDSVQSATDAVASHAGMRDGDVVFQVCPSDTGCCQVGVQFRVAYTDC